MRAGAGAVRVEVQQPAGDGEEKGRVRVTDTVGRTEEYDAVVFACHADQAVRMLSGGGEETEKVKEMSPELREVLGLLSCINHRGNDIYVHTDPRLMPRDRACWAAWNCTCVEGADDKDITVTYWLNILQVCV